MNSTGLWPTPQKPGFLEKPGFLVLSSLWPRPETWFLEKPGFLVLVASGRRPRSVLS